MAATASAPDHNDFRVVLCYVWSQDHSSNALLTCKTFEKTGTVPQLLHLDQSVSLDLHEPTSSSFDLKIACFESSPRCVVCFRRDSDNSGECRVLRMDSSDLLSFQSTALVLEDTDVENILSLVAVDPNGDLSEYALLAYVQTASVRVSRVDVSAHDDSAETDTTTLSVTTTASPWSRTTTEIPPDEMNGRCGLYVVDCTGGGDDDAGYCDENGRCTFYSTPSPLRLSLAILTTMYPSSQTILTSCTHTPRSLPSPSRILVFDGIVEKYVRRILASV